MTRKTFDKFLKLNLIPSFCATLMLLLPPVAAHGDDVYTVIVKKKQEEKAKTRWTLSEWLATKERMRWMDQWLAMNSSSPFEFFLDGAYLNRTSGDDGQQFTNARFGFAAYASIFGLQAERTTGPTPRWDALFDFRVFGYHVQSTNLTLQAGYRLRSDAAAGGTSAPLLGADLTIYLARYFGVNGTYRYEFTSSSNDAGQRFSGSEFSAGPFIDFKPLRVYGNFTRSYQSSLKGFEIGLRLFL